MTINFQDHPMTLVLFPAALTGATLNWTIVYSFFHLPALKSSFGYLSANQAIADAFHSTMFLLYFCPMVFLDIEILKYYSHHAGFLILFFYELSVFTHLVISLNRFFAIFTPFRYKTMFSDSNTKRIIFAIWTFTLSGAIFLYQYLCNMFFEEKSEFFTFTPTEFCGNIAWYADFLKNSAVVILIVFIDFFTVIKVRQISKKVVANISESQNHRISKREMRFLKQTVFQGAVFLLELLTYFLVPKYFENRWIVYLGTTFAWVSVHAADGVVVLICNPDIRNFVFSRGQLIHKDTTSQVTQKSH